MKVMQAAGEPFDICYTTYSSNRLDLAAQRGAFKPLDELLEKYGENIKKKVDSRAWTAVTHGGKIMAVPAQTPYSSAKGFAFKKTWWKSTILTIRT